ncbi:MAG: VCBS repeat-containing protein [Saprospiraceae bacterium]|nr:VCBS repeat-containing protein [Saprospiraceae bacterium]
MNFQNRLLFVLCLSSYLACTNQAEGPSSVQSGETLFTTMPASYTGVNFANTLSYTEDFNPYTYRNFYNGGGVGLGDINNDGLIDIFLCGNQVDNKLYLNKGNFKFEDITRQAGVACSGVWTSGVSLADVNSDGWLDIYVCKSGAPEGDRRYNELFINQGDGTFVEKAREFGIADLGLSAHAAFFDYDRDGDLDCYLLNNSMRPVGGFDLRPGLRERRDLEGGNKLYRNDLQSDGTIQFVDVSEETGIYGSAIGFGLGVTIGDVNRDGWLDIYVSNDYFERDYLYLNQTDGTFKEVLTDCIGEISLSSMGADMADINNDGRPEIFVTDMLPEGNARMKTKTKFDNWDKYALMVKTGYHRQFTRNVFQYNRGIQPENGLPIFSELGRLSGVESTDWSWGALIADLDLDGRKDIFVANGIVKDLTDQDYINFYSDPNTIRQIIDTKGAVIEEMIDAIPSEPLANYAFQNQGGLLFTNEAAAWGLDKPGFSNGSAYGDLDNDGDLDLVLNNANDLAWIYRNEAREKFPERHFLSVTLKGKSPNLFAMGSQVELYAGDQIYYQELTPMRGFQSTVDNRLHFGLGTLTKLDSLFILWPNGDQTSMQDIPVDQMLVIQQPDGISGHPMDKTETPIFSLLEEAGMYRHKENEFTDFDRDHLLYYMLSTEGPKLAAADVNKDGLLDYYVGGSKGYPGVLFTQTPDGKFRESAQALFTEDAGSEDAEAVFFDADGDGDSDLYVCSGGNEFSSSSRALLDRLYINNGQGVFSKSETLPFSRPSVSSCVRPVDFDNDGDMDLFVGTRLMPFLYGIPVSGFLFQNTDGHFTDVSASLAPELENLGMITDAAWLDVNGDKRLDLVVVGDWMGVTIFLNKDGQFTKTAVAGLEHSNGFWHCVEAADLDQDGDLDLVLGNQGWNSRIKASTDQPASMFINDFDQNGTAEQILSAFNGANSYPLVLRHDLIMQLPSLKKKYLKYEQYKDEQVEDIFSPQQLEHAVYLEAQQMASCVALNDGQGNFALTPLPLEAQFAPVYAILIQDFNEDSKLDLLLGGNFYGAKPEIGMHDASFGQLLIGNGKGQFEPLEPHTSGLYIKGEIRDFLPLGNKRVLVARNNDFLQLWEY